MYAQMHIHTHTHRRTHTHAHTHTHTHTHTFVYGQATAQTNTITAYSTAALTPVRRTKNNLTSLSPTLRKNGYLEKTKKNLEKSCCKRFATPANCPCVHMRVRTHTHTHTLGTISKARQHRPQSRHRLCPGARASSREDGALGRRAPYPPWVWA